MTGSRWRAENVQTLKAMWGEGQSGNQIAQALSLTRGAVMGKIERLNLFGREMPAKEPLRRCQLSEVGKLVMFQRNPGKRARQGSITNEARNGTCWSVLWDGLSKRSIDVCAKEYIEIMDGSRPVAIPIAIPRRRAGPKLSAERKAQGNYAGGLMSSIRSKRRGLRKGHDDRDATQLVKAKANGSEAPVYLPPVNTSLAAFNAAIPAEQRVTITELTKQTCHWPLWGEDVKGGFYCGAPVDHRVYCATHALFAGAGYSRDRSYGFNRSANTFR